MSNQNKSQYTYQEKFSEWKCLGEVKKGSATGNYQIGADRRGITCTCPHWLHTLQYKQEKVLCKHQIKFLLIAPALMENNCSVSSQVIVRDGDLTLRASFFYNTDKLRVA